MTDLEIVQAAADRVTSEAKVHMGSIPEGTMEWALINVTICLFSDFAAELQRLRDQVYPR